MDVNLYVLFGIVSRVISVILLVSMVIPIQLKELDRQIKLREKGRGGYWRLALELLLIVVITVTCAIVPVTYQGTRITSDSSLTLQNLSSFFTNLAILAQSIGWVRIYKSRYDDRI